MNRICLTALLLAACLLACIPAVQAADNPTNYVATAPAEFRAISRRVQYGEISWPQCAEFGEPIHVTRDRLDAMDPQPDAEISLLAAGVILACCLSGAVGFVLGCCVVL